MAAYSIKVSVKQFLIPPLKYSTLANFIDYKNTFLEISPQDILYQQQKIPKFGVHSTLRNLLLHTIIFLQ